MAGKYFEEFAVGDEYLSLMLSSVQTTPDALRQGLLAAD